MALWCDLSKPVWFLETNLTFSTHNILFLKTSTSSYIRQAILCMDKPAKALWEPLNTFARGYQQPLLWSWVCCKTGWNLSVEQVPQHNVSLSAKVLLKIIFGQYVDSVTLERMRWNVYLYMFVQRETARLYWPECDFFFFFFSFSLLPFFFNFETVWFFNNCICMCTCVYAY